MQPPQRTILVTGASGLLGSRVVPLLSRNVPDARIIAVSRNPDYVSHDGRVEVIHGDLRDKYFWFNLPRTITIVIHLAAVIPWTAEQKDDENVVMENLLPIALLVEYSQFWPNLQQVIYSSSVSVYGRSTEWLNECSKIEPVSLYGGAKRGGEDLLACMPVRRVRCVSLRYSSLYAHGQYEGTVLPIMVNRARGGQDIVIFGDGTRTQDFLHCEDAANAILLALQQSADGIYNIGTGTPVTMTELAQTVSRVFANGETKIRYEPPRDDDPGIKLDISKARRELNYQPELPLEAGLRKLKQEMENRSE